MKRMIMVCGPTGVGKTTYAVALANDIGAVRFSIDPWMQTLFAKDITTLDYAWMIERVNRCYEQIWSVCQQILMLDGAVILDLGFTEKIQRDDFMERGKLLGLVPELHYLHADSNTRKKRVEKRNKEQDPEVYAFEVTDFMFDFMEQKFEIPNAQELENGRQIDLG